MANKTFGYYNNGETYNPGTADRLIIEHGSGHLAFLVANSDNGLEAFEWFKFNDNVLNNSDHQIADIKNNSKLLDDSYEQTTFFINNSYNIWVPSAQFDQQNIAVQLNAVHGQNVNQQVEFDIIDEAAVVNIYRVPIKLVQNIQQVHTVKNIQHTYTRLLQKNLQLKNMPDNYVQLFVYDAEFLISVFIQGKFTLMRSFDYQAEDDILYHLVNICQQLKIDLAEVVLKIGGFINTYAALYSHVNRVFRNVSIETVSPGKLNFETGENAHHYFTPLFNLAV